MTYRTMAVRSPDTWATRHRHARPILRAARHVAAITAILLAGVLATPLPASAAALTARTAEDVWSRAELLRPTYTGTPYASTPRTTAPYAAGALQGAFVADGLDTLNLLRYVAGLPDDVYIDDTLQVKAQHGSVLLVKEFSHTPAKPADMTQSFYDLAYAGTSKSNIGAGYSDLELFQLGCVDDQSASNIDRVGHRRWLFNPAMQKTAMGFAENRTTTYAIDSSRPTAVSYDLVAWPPAGVMPVQLFGSSVPWSITLNPSRYDWGSEPHTVSLRRMADSRTWTFTAADTDTSGEYFSFNTGGYGVANAFIFRPDPDVISYRPGDRFEVTLSGGIYAAGTNTPATVRYTTEFIPLGRPDASEDDDSAAAARPLAQGASVAHTIEWQGDEDWHAVAATRGEPLDLAVSVTSGNGVTVTVFDGATQLYARSLTGTTSEFSWTPPESKTYTIKITAPVTSRLVVTSYVIALDTDPVVPGTDPLTVARIAGADRYQTAIAVAEKAFPSGASTVIVATAANWPDALGGAALAGALDAPILLTAPNSLPASVRSAIVDLQATKVIILGGASAVSEGVAESIDAIPGVSVERIAGADRYQTARRIASRAMAEQGDAFTGTAFVATGSNFPDALGASPLAAAQGWPIYLVGPAGLDQATIDAMQAAGVQETIVLGSTAAVPGPVATGLARALSGSVTRLEGSDRYETALRVAEYGVSEAGLSWDRVAVATGGNFPDALAGGVLQGGCGSVMVLTPPTALDNDVRARFAAVGETVGEVRLLGSASAISNAVRDQAVAALRPR